MSALPKRRISHSRKNNRRSHHHIDLPTLTICPNCKAKIQPHNACIKCGKYKDKVILPL
jgi:large subunit ribosomal protein L32